MAAHSSSLAWRIPWTEESGGLHTVHGVTSNCWFPGASSPPGLILGLLSPVPAKNPPPLKLTKFLLVNLHLHPHLAMGCNSSLSVILGVEVSFFPHLPES